MKASRCKLSLGVSVRAGGAVARLTVSRGVPGRYGVGAWAKILGNFEFKHGRSTVDLKDKWRNLEKGAQVCGPRDPELVGRSSPPASISWGESSEAVVSTTIVVH